MANIELRSYQQIAGPMVAKLLAETDLTDLSPGSVFLTIIEAAASSDLLSEAKLLQLLKIRNVDKAQGVDLENLASELGVIPSRLGATSASVLLQFTDSAFSKLSSTVFAGAISPTAGDTYIKVISALGWPSAGTIYIGRGTSSSEAISYVSLVNSGSYWQVNLASPLTKDHLVGEEVVVGQGGDRTVPSNTICRVPPTAGNQPVEFKTLTDVTLLDGENVLPNVSAVATTPGSSGNVAINKIIEFASLPFSTAEVTNAFPGSGGADSETDPELRQRIKDHVHSLSKGTERAIIRAVIGVSDPDESKRVVTAFLREPTTAGALGILFIDDGTGFSPSFAGVGEEEIITSAAGTEQFLQLQQFPLVKAQAVSIGQEPFALYGGESFFFEVDNESEEKSLPTSSYGTPGVATAQEIAEAINNAFTTVEARAKDGRVFVTPVSDLPEYIRVGEVMNNANSIVRFPTRKQYTIRLYQNDVALEKNGLEAILQSYVPAQWPTFGASETLQLEIDGISSPLVTFTDLDFQTYSSSNTINGATALDWVKVFAKKFIGITASAKDDGSFIIKSNKGKSADASLTTLSGSLIGSLFAAGSSAGLTPQFKLNRLLGQIELINRANVGDNIKAGTVNTAGFVKTLPQATFDLSTVLGTAAKMVVITEAPATILAVDQIASLLTFTAPSLEIQRISGAVQQFAEVKADDWVYLYNLPVNGLYRVYSVDTTNYQYVDVYCPSPVTSTDTPDSTTKQIFFFRSSGMPQEITLTSGASVANTTVVSDINTQLSGGIAEVLDNDIVRIKTLRLDGDGALAIPVLAGSAKNLGFVAGSFSSNDPHIAATESGDLMGLPTGKYLVASDDLVSPYDTFISSGSPFSDATYHNRPMLDYLGAAARLIRQPLEKVDPNTITLRALPPNQTIGLGPDVRTTAGTGLEFGQADNMVFIIDNDAAKKTFDIPMYVDGTIAAPTVPNLTQFDANDAAGDNLGTSLRWQGYRFDDYRAWFKAKNDLPASVVDSQIHLAAQMFGPNGQNILAGIFYPIVPNSEASAAFSVDYLNSDILIDIQLASGAERVAGIATNEVVSVSYTGPVAGVYTYKVRFPTPVSLATTLVGDIVSLSDSAFSSNNLGSMSITNVSNLLDASLSYEHLTETSTGNAVVGGTTVNFAVSPVQAFQTGDLITTESIRHNTTNQTATTVTVPVGGAYAAGGGAFTINNIAFTYTAYNSGTGVFSGVAPDPTALVLIGQELKQTVTPTTYTIQTVNTPTQVVTSTSIPTGDGWELTVKHKAVTANGTPSFAAAVGDYIQVGGYTLTITNVVSSTIFNVDTAFAFSGLLPGNISRIYVTGEKSTVGTNEKVTLADVSGVRIFELDATNNTATNIISVINSTAGVKDLVLASNAIGSAGSGQIVTSTEDELDTGDTRIRLLNGESFVLYSQNANPSFMLKEPLEVAPDVGEVVRLLPMTPQNVVDHLSKKQISGLSIAADINLVNMARHAQISSKIAGGVSQVYAVGGKASGNNVFDIRNTALEISNSIGVIEVDQAVSDFVSPGYTVKLSQSGRAAKDKIVPFSALTTAEIQIAGLNLGRIVFSDAIAAMKSYSHLGSVVWAVRKLSGNRSRYDLVSGTASLPASLQAGDWVFVGNGGSYAGVTPVQLFASANKGYFQIVETDSSTYFDVENKDATEEFATALSAPFIFMPYHSTMIGDQVSIDTGAPFQTDNRGTFTITAVDSLNSVIYSHTSVINEGPLALGTAGVDSILFLDQGFTTYRKVLSVSPNPNDPTNRSLIVITPGYDISLLNEGQNAKITFPTRLSYGTDPVPGISGYQYWTGLKRRVQRVLDGYAPDSTNFPGVRAAGVAIEAREPQIQRVTLNIKVKTNQGVALASIADTIKSGVIGFINSLGLGADVVLSEVVSIIQQTAGVDSVVLVNPTLDTERVVINDNAIARTSPAEITLS